MCPPVSVRQGKEGMSYLYASWRYQLQYGDQLRICFTCFKVTFLGLRALLQSANWADLEDDDWDSDLMDPAEEEEEAAAAAAATAPAEAGSEQGASQGLEPNWVQGLGQPALWGPAGWGWGTLASPPGESEEMGPDHDFVPTELNPQDAAPLGLGPEDADWTQGLPWRFGGFPACLHWPHTSSPWQGLLRVDRSPGEPMLLELDTTQAGDPAEVEACLLDLQFLSMVDHTDAFYLQKMAPRWARRTAGQGWTVLLEPEEVWAMALPNAAQGQDPQRWKLSVLEPSPTGHTVELAPADVALLRRGFTILSYSPWAKSDAADGGPASRPQSSTQGEGPSTPETWSSGPREPWESLGPGAAALSPVPLPKAPEMRD